MSNDCVLSMWGSCSASWESTWKIEQSWENGFLIWWHHYFEILILSLNYLWRNQRDVIFLNGNILFKNGIYLIYSYFKFKVIYSDPKLNKEQIAKKPVLIKNQALTQGQPFNRHTCFNVAICFNICFWFLYYLVQFKFS